jgi:hypothetical protein
MGLFDSSTLETLTALTRSSFNLLPIVSPVVTVSISILDERLQYLEYKKRTHRLKGYGSANDAEFEHE